MQAQVFKIHSDFYWVQADFEGTETIFECKIRANLKKQNVDTFIEIGPSKILSGLVRKTLKDVNISAVCKISDLNF